MYWMIEEAAQGSQMGLRLDKKQLGFERRELAWAGLVYSS